MDYIYGNILGPETISKEYKLFTFFPKGLNLDYNDHNNNEFLINSGKWLFNDSVLKNLNFYLEYYLPKYTSAYLNKCSEVDSGELLIGISDEGFISGIPFQGDIRDNNILRLLNEKIRNLINDNLKFNIDNEDIFNYFDWELIDIKVDGNLINKDSKDKSELDKKMDEYNKYKLEYEKDYKKFLLKKKVWYDLVNRFNDRLHNMLNDKENRDEIKKYIIRKSKKNKDKDFDSKVLIELLESKYVFNSITNTQLSYYKFDKNSIWYWVTRWKDDMIDLVKILRPVRPSSIPNNLHPLSIITTVIDMIPRWVKNNKNINLYLLRFIFKKPKEDIEIFYKENSYEKSCYRCKMDDTVCIFPF